MIIKNIEEYTKTCQKTFKYSAKRFIISFIAVNLLAIAATFLFLFIENCYDYVPVSLSYREKKFLEICAQLNRNLTLHFNGTVDAFTMNVHTFCSNDNTTARDTSSSACEISRDSLMKWFEYVFTIHYTIGKK